MSINSWMVLLVLFSAQASALLDPTAPSDYAAPAPSSTRQVATSPKLQMIVSDTATPYAVINNQQVSVGQRVSGYRVVSINAERVIIERDGQQLTLRFRQPKVVYE